jgi:uracil-DNA glycosylase
MKQLNLTNYFNMLFWNNPEYLFIGEAPGKDGCVLTGVTFSSERSAIVIWGSVETLSCP